MKQSFVPALNYSLTHMSSSTEHYISPEFNVDGEWVAYESLANFSSGLPSGWTRLTWPLFLEIHKLIQLLWTASGRVKLSAGRPVSASLGLVKVSSCWKDVTPWPLLVQRSSSGLVGLKPPWSQVARKRPCLDPGDASFLQLASCFMFDLKNSATSNLECLESALPSVLL